MPLETRLDGDPATVHAAASYVREELRAKVDALATVTCRQRSRLASAWSGETGEAFGRRASALTSAADVVATVGDGAASILDDVAAALARAQDALAGVRAEAHAAGLRVSGTLVLEPTQVDLHDAWARAASEATEHRADWAGALERAAAAWRRHDDELSGLGGNLIVGAYSGSLVARLAPVLSGEAAAQTARAQRLMAHADEMMRDGKFTGGRPSHFYELLADSRNADVQAAKYAELAKSPELPRNLKGGIAGAGGVLAVLTTAWGVSQDIEAGESTEQAVVSNVGGTLSGIAAGTATGAGLGAAVGSVVPGAGTAVGAVVGAAVGTGVGVVSSGAIDSMYENGVDSAGDVVDAVGDGFEDLGDLVQDLGGSGGDLIESIF